MGAKEMVMEIAGFEIIEVTKDDMSIRYFAQSNGKAVTKELGSLDAVRCEIELLEAQKSSEWISDALPHGAASIVHPKSILLYVLGKFMLRIFTLGRYPKSGVPHNADFVTMFPGVVLAAVFVVITVIYS